MTFRVRVEIEDFDNNNTCSVERTVETDRWDYLIDVFLDALRGASFVIADDAVEITSEYDPVPHDREKFRAYAKSGRSE